jgi:hypothetical protein
MAFFATTKTSDRILLPRVMWRGIRSTPLLKLLVLLGWWLIVVADIVAADSVVAVKISSVVVIEIVAVRPLYGILS